MTKRRRPSYIYRGSDKKPQQWLRLIGKSALPCNGWAEKAIGCKWRSCYVSCNHHFLTSGSVVRFLLCIDENFWLKRQDFLREVYSRENLIVWSEWRIEWNLHELVSLWKGWNCFSWTDSYRYEKAAFQNCILDSKSSLNVYSKGTPAFLILLRSRSCFAGSSFFQLSSSPASWSLNVGNRQKQELETSEISNSNQSA